MNKIKDFFNQWGLSIIVLFCVAIFLNTCGTKTKIDSLNKKVATLEQTINFNDSVQSVKFSIEREISILETAREVVYSENSIVRNVSRPDDLMNEYDSKIKALQQKLVSLPIKK